MRGRYRENRYVSQANWTGSAYDAEGKLASGPYYSTADIITHYNGMNDIVGGSREDKPMNHIKSETTLYSPSWTTSHSEYGFVVCSGCRIVEADLGFSEPAFTGPEWEQLTSEFLARVADPMRSSLSLANYLYELKDLKRTLWFLKDRLDKIGSGGFLSWNFGVLPFVSDTKALLLAYDRFLARLDYLKKNENKPIKVTSNFSKTIPGNPLVTPSLLPKTSGTLSWKITWTQDTEVTAHMWAVVIYDTSMLQGISGMRRAIASFLGFDTPGKIVYNALPYTFVLDWFTNLFTKLTSYSILEELPRKVIRQGYWIKGVGVTCVSGGHVSDIQCSNVMFAQRKWKTFRRSTGLPSVSVTWLNGLTDLSLKQLALGFALIHVRT